MYRLKRRSVNLLARSALRITPDFEMWEDLNFGVARTFGICLPDQEDNRLGAMGQTQPLQPQYDEERTPHMPIDVTQITNSAMKTRLPPLYRA